MWEESFGVLLTITTGTATCFDLLPEHEGMTAVTMGCVDQGEVDGRKPFG